MNQPLNFIICLFLFAFYTSCLAQTSVKVSRPVLELIDNNVIIKYNIINSNQSDILKIWIEITDTTGNKIDARSLSGDIGEEVSGGNNKKITWNLTADNIYLDAGVFIQIYAEKLPSTDLPEIVKPIRRISRGGAIARSFVLPGWGLSKINEGKPHWLKGVAGYGCIAASVVYNKKAVSSYDDYSNSQDPGDMDTYFDNSVKEDNLSEVFAYAAIGIWVVDLVWTTISSSKPGNETKYSQAKGFSINPAYDYQINSPMIVLKYNF